MALSTAARPFPDADGVAEPAEQGAQGTGGRGRRGVGERIAEVVQRLWCLPLGVHLAVLTGLLALSAWAAGSPGEFSVDEGLAIVQAKHLAAGGGWHLPLPLPVVDPAGLTFPYPRHAATFATYAKHPLYPVLLSLASRLGGVWGMVGLSVVGTAAAAWFAALLVRRLRPGLDRWVLWAVGLASPLLFDGLTVFAHSLAAALAALIALAVVEHWRNGRWWWLPLAGLAAAAATMLRTEALLLLGPGVLALLLLGAWRRERRLLLLGGALALATLVARSADNAWAAAIGGGGVSLADGGGHDPLGALHAAPSTLFGPSLGPPVTAGARLLVIGTVALLFAALALRSRRWGARVIVPSALAVTAVLAGVVVGRPVAVPGLFVVCPVLVVGLMLGRWQRAPIEIRVLAGCLAAFVALVLVGQYDVGGSLEWGARYLAVGVPLLVLVAVWGIAEATRRAKGPELRTVVAVVMTCSVLLAALGVTSLRRRHQAVDRTISAVLVKAREAPSGDGGVPVVMTTDQYLPLWRLSLQVRLMRIEPGNVGRWSRALGEAGVSTFVLFDNGRVEVQQAQ